MPLMSPGAPARRVLSNRLLQFVALGAVIFATARTRGRHPIAVSSADRPPHGIERAIEDEILFREGTRLGFDKNDAIIRQRVIQKTLYLAEELAGASEPPTEAELRAFYDRTEIRWHQPERWRLVQVFARDRTRLETLAPELARRVARDAAVAELGEPSPVPTALELGRPQLAAQLGDALVAALPRAATAGFLAPLRSPYGWHAVRVIGYTPESPAPFEQARAQLVGAYVVERRRAAVAAFLDRAFASYAVTLDGQPVAALHPDGRMAIRKSASAED